MTAPDQELIKVRDELLRKIGRNLVNFQKLEKLLKCIILSTKMSGSITELEANKSQNADEVHVQTMGTLVKRYLDHIHSDDSDSAISDQQITEPHIYFSISFVADPNYVEIKKELLESLLRERNHLVHHLLLDVDLESVESCLQMSQKLDEQRERQKAEHEYLQFQLKHISDIHAELAAYYASDEFKREIDLALLQQSPVVALLLDLTTNLARADGWTLLENVGRQVHTLLPNEFANLKKSYGYKTLKDVLIASGLFDVAAEATEGGGKRTMYRLKPDIKIDY